MEIDKIHQGNCLEKLVEIPSNSVDLVYFDPPFFTQKKHTLVTRDESKKYAFSDSWDSLTEYLALINACLVECQRILKDTGSVFLHCDKVAAHYIRVELDKVFGSKQFRSEIIWSYLKAYFSSLILAIKMNIKRIKYELQNLISGKSGASYDALIQTVASHLRRGERTSPMAEEKHQNKAQETKKLIDFASTNRKTQSK